MYKEWFLKTFFERVFFIFLFLFFYFFLQNYVNAELDNADGFKKSTEIERKLNINKKFINFRKKKEHIYS